MAAMKNIDVLKVLQSRGVTAFYHANSVLTACTFLEVAALLSRGYVEKHKLKQTPQNSDQIDEKYGIWNDIFLDTVDIHDRARRKNHYGPVLFVLNVESVLKDKELEGTLRITRKNPTRWSDGQQPKDRYFETVDEFANSFSFGDFDKHFTFRPESGRIPLASHLNHILLDDPQGSLGDASTFEVAVQALKTAAKRGKIQIEVHKRQCRDACKCLGNYSAEQATQKVMFAA
jgi:hypothetical protein